MKRIALQLAVAAAAMWMISGCASTRPTAFEAAPYQAVAVEPEPATERCLRQRCTPPIVTRAHADMTLAQRHAPAPAPMAKAAR